MVVMARPHTCSGVFSTLAKFASLIDEESAILNNIGMT